MRFWFVLMPMVTDENGDVSYVSPDSSGSQLRLRSPSHDALPAIMENEWLLDSAASDHEDVSSPECALVPSVTFQLSA